MVFSSQMARNIDFFKSGASGGVMEGRPDHPLKQATVRNPPYYSKRNGSPISPVNIKNCHPSLSHLPPSTFSLTTWLKPPARYVTKKDVHINTGHLA
jgi:hypothetical protein